MLKQALDSNVYLKLQQEKIKERVELFGNKLYLEFGGKLFDDCHATRVFPGFNIDAKVKVLLSMKDDVEFIVTVKADDIQAGKVRGDTGLSYEDETLRLIDEITDAGLQVSGVVITQYSHQPAVDVFLQLLKSLNVKTYLHYVIKGYPHDLENVFSEKGFELNDYVITTRPIVVVTAPGPGSGKMATCLSQIHADFKRGIKSGYAKYETFPVWNLPLKHPINLAYEAATADLNDVTMVDYYHFEAYSVPAVSYNRDMEVYPVLQKMFERIYGESPYKSPTDMGVNMIGFAIVDDDTAVEAAKAEIIRRYYSAMWKNKTGHLSDEGLDRIRYIIESLNINPKLDRACVGPALQKAQERNAPAVAIELHDGTIVTGKETGKFTAGAAALINALKHLASINKRLHLLSPQLIKTIQQLKQENMYSKIQMLSVNEVLITLAITANTNSFSEVALAQTSKLFKAQAHSSIRMNLEDKNAFKQLGIDVSSEPVQTSYFVQS
ncbi:MAG: DUF1846 domain-containing protein [Erysipelotrichaceae bacterium]|nr:DUF1846 domain-containing protein [Erysipelotrichaceae bacterium]